MKISKFEDLEIWKMGLTAVKLVYDVTSKKPFSTDFNLRDQIRRSAISISSNIVEGFEKRNNNEFCRFLRIAKGSTGEARNQLFIALAVKYINKEEFDKINSLLLELACKIGALINYLEKSKHVTRNS
jgi:four helix bundle protein